MRGVKKKHMCITPGYSLHAIRALRRRTFDTVHVDLLIVVRPVPPIGGARTSVAILAPAPAPC